jgi:hypothetical protein
LLNSQTIYRLFGHVQAETDVYTTKQVVGSFTIITVWAGIKDDHRTWTNYTDDCTKKYNKII